MAPGSSEVLSLVLVCFVVGDDLVLRFLQLDQLAKLVGLARLPFAYDFPCAVQTD
jgi:hypothetical protein